MISPRWSRLISRAVNIQLSHIGVRLADRGGYTALVDAALSFRSAFWFLIVVDTQL